MSWLFGFINFSNSILYVMQIFKKYSSTIGLLNLFTSLLFIILSSWVVYCFSQHTSRCDYFGWITKRSYAVLVLFVCALLKKTDGKTLPVRVDTQSKFSAIFLWRKGRVHDNIVLIGNDCNGNLSPFTIIDFHLEFPLSGRAQKAPKLIFINGHHVELSPWCTNESDRAIFVLLLQVADA